MADLLAYGEDIIGFPGGEATAKVKLMKLLWENPSPTSAFAAQTVALSDMDYDLYFTVFRVTSDEWYVTYILDAKTSGKNWVESLNSTMASLYNRGLKVVSNGISFDDARVGATTNNSYMIPYRIYGIKLEQEIPVVAENVSTLAANCLLSDGETSVEDVVDELTDDSGFTTVNANIKYRKIGRIVEATIIIPNTAATSWTTLGALPAECAPGTSIYDCPYASGSTRAIFYIGNDGIVQYQNNSGSQIAAVKTYIANIAT